MTTIENNRLRDEAAPVVVSSDLLVGFLYELMRDHLPCGTVESLMRQQHNTPFTFTNGHLARYAEYIASRLREVKI